MSITLCSNPDRGVFSTQTGHGIPKGLVKLGGTSRDGELVTLEEAYKIGLEEGLLVEFRSTDSFLSLCRHFLAHNPSAFEDLCRREEVDPEAIKARLSMSK